jgi:hypothetical protein
VFGATQGKEIMMMTNFGHAAVVLALLAGTSSASAQYYREYDARAVVTQPVPLTQAQRTTIYRTIIPQGRGRQPIVRERIVTEPVAPLVRERVVTGALDAYAYGDTYAYGGAYAYGNSYGYRDAYAYQPSPGYQRRYVVEPDAYSANASAYYVGGRVASPARLAPLPPAAIAEVPSIRYYRYMTVGSRVLLVDPDTGVIVAEVTP